MSLFSAVSQMYPQGSCLTVFNEMLPALRKSLVGSVDGLCVEAISMKLMTLENKAGILEGGNNFTHSSRFLEHFALKIDVTPSVLALFMNMLCGLHTRDCDELVREMSK